MKQNIFLGLVMLVACVQMQASEGEEKKIKSEASKKTSAQQQQQQQNRPSTTDDIDSEFRSSELSDEQLRPIIEALYPHLLRPRPAQTGQQGQNQ